MTVSLKTRKMLWGRSGMMCAICRDPLLESETETDDPSILGEECHIVAKEEDGPRGNSDLPPEKRDLYDNLILLCQKHHKIIDDQPDKYPVDTLKQIKVDHLQWFQDVTGQYDAAKQRDIEHYAALSDEWAIRAQLSHWESFSYGLLSDDQPSMSKQDHVRIDDLRKWLFTRVWPKRLAVFEAGYENFRRILTDLFDLFGRHAVNEGGVLVTSKFYKIKEWDDERYRRLADDYDHHVGMIQDLTIELTRAANLLCDRIREGISPTFRREDGIVLARQGLGSDLREKLLRVEYRPEERTEIPYPGIESFVHVRTTRSFYYGDQK